MLQKQITDYLYQNKELPKAYTTIDRDKLVELCENRVKAWKEANLALTNDSNKNHEKLWAIYRDFECIPTATATEAVKQWLDEDRVVHFFLGLIYAENAESINEFCKNEKQLLETRINHQKLSLANVIGMCQELKIPAEQVLSADIAEELKLMRKPEADKPFELKDFLKVEYRYVTKSVGEMKTLLKRGLAYIHYEDLLTCLFDQFENRLKERMQKTSNSQEYLRYQEDEEFNFFKRIRNADSGNQDGIQVVNGKITAANIKSLSDRSFPLCMKYLVDNLVRTHHLKYTGRVQLQLFLKTAGMEYPEAAMWWKQELSKKAGAKDFDKEYLYGLRHNYGLEGKMANYGCWSCQRIMKEHPGNGEFHGCPIKLLSKANLSEYLRGSQIEQAAIDKILNLKEGSHIQVACREIWNAKHNLDGPGAGTQANFGVVSPIVYFSESLKYHDKK